MVSISLNSSKTLSDLDSIYSSFWISASSMDTTFYNVLSNMNNITVATSTHLGGSVGGWSYDMYGNFTLYSSTATQTITEISISNASVGTKLSVFMNWSFVANSVNSVEDSLSDAYFTGMTYTFEDINGNTFICSETYDQLALDGSTTALSHYSFSFTDGEGGEIEIGIDYLPFATYETILDAASLSSLLTNLDNDANLLSGNDVFDATNSTEAHIIHGYAGNDILITGSGNDILIGGTGVDTMIGGLGNDIYYVDNSADITIENSTSATEIDTVVSSVSRTLSANIEKLLLSGTGAINGHGNALNNTITGNSANNTLNGNGGSDIINGNGGNDIINGGTSNDIANGGIGNDTVRGGMGNDTVNGGMGNDILSGGAGRDNFVFNTVLSTVKNRDIITDFSVSDDTIKLENSVFKQLTRTGILDAKYFKDIAVSTQDSDDYIIYNSQTGVISYDADGNGSGLAIQIALIGTTTHAHLTNSDIVVI